MRSQLNGPLGVLGGEVWLEEVGHRGMPGPFPSHPPDFLATTGKQLCPTTACREGALSHHGPETQNQGTMDGNL
jgi:hypothetical protein